MNEGWLAFCRWMPRLQGATEGPGLGLAISQKLAEAMGGRMWAESGGMGLGTRFRWTMACRLPPAESAGQLPAAQKGLSKQRSLAVSLPPKVILFCSHR